ncbi:hypothetical protein FDP25_04870 [Roseovarius sp. A21]|uniref:D-alanine transfer protein n=1 Tax=Roseovarius bejariae TaxID=2576383 RepID=A0A844CHG7_9RHOB|nr:hypothetical protein [Roseovarius bejariae]MRU14761.1 hypothetical protein [Roseovarius bejariae]
MDIADRPVLPFPRRAIARFLALFLVLYGAAAWVAEATVARTGQDTPFQRLLALKGQQVDWAVLGASHALPLRFGDIPARLQAETGQTMAVLAEVGAGPLYNHLVFKQAMQDIAPRRLLYVVDAFAFAAPDWNEARISDRTLLRKTPLRLSTARHMAAMVLHHGTDPAGLADYLTGFSKLNPPDRFPQEGWTGAAGFDRKVRLSRHAVEARADYLYPDPPQADTMARYLGVLASMFDAAQAQGIRVTVIKLPVPEAFRDALPDEAAFDRRLRAELAPRGIPYHDLGGALPDPRYFFDTDHLNRAGVTALYDQYLMSILAAAPAR